MTHRSLTVVHQSSPRTCLARARAEAEGADRVSDPARIGTACHAAVEKIAYEDAAGRKDHLATGLAEIDRIAGEIGLSPAGIGEAKSILRGALGPKSKLSFSLRQGWRVSPEFHWMLDEAFKPTKDATLAAFAGTMDRLSWHPEHGVEVTDYKTVYARTSADGLESNWQARVYSLAALALFPGVNAVRFAWVNLRHGYSTSAEFKRGDRWEDSTRDHLTAQRAARLRALAFGEWPETLGSDCAWCPVLHKCSAIREAVEGGAEPGLEPPELARQYLGVSALAGRLERAVKAVYEESGPIALGGGEVLGGKPRGTWETVLSYEQAMERLRAMGMTPEQEVEWFRFVAEHQFASRVRGAIYELAGDAAKGIIDTDEIVTPGAAATFAAWWPDGKKDKHAAVSAAAWEERS